MSGFARTLKIAVISNSSVKANREKRSGVLRYFADLDNVQVLLLDHMQSGVRQLYGNRDIAGIINVGTGKKYSFGVPCVTLDCCLRQSATALTVNIDNRAVAEAAARFLISRGNTNFAFVETNIPYERSHSSERSVEFLNTLRQNGYTAQVFAPRGIAATHSTAELTELSNWLKKLPKPCGVFAYADSRAQLIVDACNLARLSIPDQVNLIGVDNDIGICEFCNPTLTSIWPDFEQAGFLAARLLHQRLLGQSASKTTLLRYGVKCIVERASTQDLRGAGRLVSMACEYIRLHYKEPLKSADVAQHLNVSRRLLDLRFREITSTTIQKEVERLRMSEAERLFRSTELSALEISVLCGYRTIMAFRKALKRTFNTSLTKRLRPVKTDTPSTKA